MTAYVARIRQILQDCDPLIVEGRVLRASGLVVEASLPSVAVGTACDIRATDGRRISAEVIGFSGSTAFPEIPAPSWSKEIGV